MARPKKGQKGYEIANERWRKTMQMRYGGKEGLHKKMQEMGRKGGRAGHTGGFHANRELARIAGKKGGTISRRGPSKKPRKDKGIPRNEYNADTNFVEHVETKKPVIEVKPPEVKKRIWKWPWSK